MGCKMYLVWNLAGIIDMVTGTNGLAAGIASVILAFDVKCGSSELAALAPRHWHLQISESSSTNTSCYNDWIKI